MPVPEQTPVATFTGNGVTTDFPFAWGASASSHVVVEVDGVELVQGVDYTVLSIGDAGGTVRITPAPVLDAAISVFRRTPLERVDPDYQEGGPFKAETVDFDFNTLWRALQEIGYTVSLVPKLPVGSPLAGTVRFPPPGAGYFLRWNAAGNAIEAVDVETAASVSTLKADLADPDSVGHGANLVAFKQPSAAAVGRTVHDKLRERISVRDFGAKGDAVHDDTTAIQAAVDYARTKQNAEVYFPPHEPGQFYATTAPIVIDGPVTIRGDGPNAVLLLGVGLSAGQYVLDFDCVAVDVVEHIELLGFTVRSDNGAPNGIRLKNAAYVLTKDVRLYGLNRGIVLEGTRTFSNHFENVNSYALTENTVRFEPGFSGGGHFNFIGCTFTGDTGFYFPSTAAADSINFNGCNFEQCVTNSLFVGGSCRGLSIVGCRTEGCDGDDFQINPGAGEAVEGLVISGTSFTTDSSASIPITLGGAGGTVRGFSITGNQVEFAGLGGSFVKLNGDGESGIVAGNSFAQSNTTPISARRAGVVVFGNENSSGK
ncbi:MAG TPA: glycosyl hydrolase family 28-related protein, partial [Zeimonas sp.]